MEWKELFKLFVVPAALPTIVSGLFWGIVAFQLRGLKKSNDKLNNTFIAHLNDFHSRTKTERQTWKAYLIG